MLLVDTDVKTFLSNGTHEPDGQTAIFNGDEKQVSTLGYDLRSEHFYRDGASLETCLLEPGESIFVGTSETIAFDNSTVGKLTLRNSRIRMGLSMDAPVYLPGHRTQIIFRLTNLSSDEIILKHGESYVTLLFEQLEKPPEKPYSGTFQNEFDFSGLGNYKSEYADQIQSIGKKINDIKDVEKTLYGNVLAILSVFVAVFTLLNVNISLAASGNPARVYFIFNLSVIGSISALALLLVNLIGKEKPSKYLWLIPAISFLAVAIIAVLS